MKLGFLGFGTIANAVARGIAQDGHDISVSERSAGLSSAFVRDVPNSQIRSNSDLVRAADVVFIGLLPDQLPDVLQGLPFRQGQTVVSFAAGVSRAAITPWVAPARVEAIMIPFPRIATGGSPILTVPHSDLLEQLFGARNTLFAASDETGLAPYMAAQAMLLPIAQMAGDGARWLSDETGDPAKAETFLRSLITSSLSAAPMDQQGALEKLQNDLSTPGGFNAQMRDHLSETGTFRALASGLDALKDRQKTP